MNAHPTILVVGAEDIYLKLSAPFPPSICDVIHADTVSQALDRAASASVVVIDSGLAEGPMVLCRRLRSDPVTSEIPLVLIYQQGQKVPQAITDASIPIHDFDKLTQSIRHLVPDLFAPTPVGLTTDFPVDDDSLFNDEPMTVVYRRPEAGGDESWPPPPPTYEPEQDMVEFALAFSGFMNSIIEAIENPSTLSPDQFTRLDQVSSQIPEEAETCLDTIQSGINEALMGKDLDRMKVLSEAKNRLYEKLQHLRSLLSNMEPLRTQMQTAAPTPREPGPAAPRPPSGARSSSDSLPSLPASDLQKKSKLTLAAEAKEKAERAAQRASLQSRKKAQREKKEKRDQGSARRASSRLPGSAALWIALAAVVVLGAGAYIALSLIKRTPAAVKSDPGNSPPEMLKATLRQTMAGVFVNTKARDHEKDRISFKVRWFLNGEPIGGATSARLVSSKYQVGDSVFAEVRPSDGNSLGSAMRSRELVIKAVAPKTRSGPKRRSKVGTSADDDLDDEEG